jgi:hypothetical protein
VAELINLRLARKAKVRAAKEQSSAQNRQRFGQSKASKALSTFDSQKAIKSLDDTRLTTTKPHEPD